MARLFHSLLCALVSALLISVACSEWSFRGSDSLEGNGLSAPEDANLQRRKALLDQVASSVTSGKVFAGDVVRSFPSDQYVKFSLSSPAAPKADDCENWMVVTTIFKATEAVNRAVMMKNWCVVVVADTKTPTDYDSGWKSEGVPDWSPRVEVLTPEAQTAMHSAFVDFIPWKTFGRKNVGFLYAIMHGARRIWDFDDDNQLNFWYRGAEEKAGVLGLDTVVDALSKRPVIEVNEVVVEPDVDVLGRVKEHHFVNPYPLLQCPKKPCWPRGYPLEDIVDSNAEHAKVSASGKITTVPTASVAIIQSLADHEPDVDAMFRLTMGTPFVFGTSGRPNHHLASSMLLLPGNTFTPLNAQATLHMYSAFWGLLLPHAIPARVSDIWRSYLTERILWDLEGDMRVAFSTSPWVVQDRNNHNLMGDFAAENMLYEDTGAFLTFLRSWECRECADVPSRMQDLWVEAYNRAYLELDDVKSLQLWLKALIDAGYQFPAVKAEHYQQPPPHKPLPTLEEAVASRPPSKGKKKNKCGDKVEDLTFLVSDLHDGTRIDMASVLASMHFKVVVTGFKGEKQPWKEAWEYPEISFDKSLSSPVFNGYATQNANIRGDVVQRHFDYFKNGGGKGIADIDVFLCSFPASICEMWLPFNKTLAFLPAHRYNLGRCSPEEWGLLNRHLRKMERDTRDTTGLWPHHIIGAMSRYDKEYVRYYLGEDSKMKLHDWFASGQGYLGRYLDLPYNPKRSEVLWVGHRPLPGNTGIPELVVEHYLYKHYTATDLLNHRAVVYYPLSVMSYRLIDLYGLALPLYIPSFKFLTNMNDDRSSTGPSYCSSSTLDSLLYPDESNVHPYSPNQEDPTSTFYWVQMADAYTFPHIILFDSYADLKQKLATTDHQKVHRLMVAHNKKRRAQLEKAICSSLEGVDKGRKVPSTYQPSLWE